MSWKFDILSITALGLLKFESKNSFADMWHI